MTPYDRLEQRVARLESNCARGPELADRTAEIEAGARGCVQVEKAVRHARLCAAGGRPSFALMVPASVRDEAAAEVFEVAPPR